MVDFVTIKTERVSSGTKREVTEVFPEFLVKKSNDLMIRGNSFYAIWDEDARLWSTSEERVQEIIDSMTRKVFESLDVGAKRAKYLRDFSSKKWSEWQQYCKSMPDNFKELDTEIIFSNTKVGKRDYITKTLNYPLEEGPIDAYDELMSVLYSPEERDKLEWAVGAIISGDSKEIQKFLVLYGGPGSGKSTFLNIVQMLFEGYHTVFDAKALGSNNGTFALEPFKNNPLIAIQHDGDLSKIEDNTKLNSIVSHETMVINEKFKSTYASRFHSFILMATNKPVRITDSKSGMIRRLIDVNPSGDKVHYKRYHQLMSQVGFELAGIAHHCLMKYRAMGKNYYDNYIPIDMMGATNDFYNFLDDNYDFFIHESNDGMSLNLAWMKYKEWCDDSKIQYPYNKKIFKDELRNYFEEFKSRHKQLKNVYFGFKKEKFNYVFEEPIEEKDPTDIWVNLKDQKSWFDEVFKDCPAQLANDKGTPSKKWEKVTTTLKDISTNKLHYVQLPENLITIDFDIRDEKGEKNLELNIAAASKWPRTYCECSKSGQGLHLHYYYIGDISRVSRVYEPGIEVLVNAGNYSVRRKLSQCNDLPIAEISSGIPLKEEVKMIDEKQVKSEKALRTLILRHLRKEIVPNTTQSVLLIKSILDEAYSNGLRYDVTNMKSDIRNFAMNSSHQALFCLKQVGMMKLKSEHLDEDFENLRVSDGPLIFYDVEVFPNLFVVCWKKHGADSVVKWINPTGSQIEELSRFKLIGFFNREYDNHILYGRMMGMGNEELFKLSQKLISDEGVRATFLEAYNLSYTDVYDFLSAGNKMSLKKWEIELGIKHNELGLEWDKPVPEELWDKVAEYCADDVNATEAVFDANQADWIAREILANMSKLTVNHKTNTHSTKIIVGNDKNPQDKFVYTDLSTIFPGYKFNPYKFDEKEYTPGAKIVNGKSWYRGEDPGEGGRVYAKPGYYINVALLDVVSMHPTSAIELNIFGDEYTARFAKIVNARKMIKAKNFEAAKEELKEFNVSEYLDDAKTVSGLADALKTVINSVYGLTSAAFPNKLRDPRNVDNIVAKRGALFMIDLQFAVEAEGYTVVHIKTDSIKVANADKYIIDFIIDFGKKYGYEFKLEDVYSKLCLVNDAVYVAKYKEPVIIDGVEHWWTATGAQFKVPYVFKTLFSGEPIEFKDMCVTKAVQSALYLDFGDDLRFIGKVGLFCPILPGKGGAKLLRRDSKTDKYHAVSGTKKKEKDEVFYFLEAETVKMLGKEKDIDISYFRIMVDEAMATLSEFVDLETLLH